MLTKSQLKNFLIKCVHLMINFKDKQLNGLNS